MRFSIVIIGIVVTLSWQNTTRAEVQPKLLGTPTLVVDPDTKTASALLKLQNTSEEDISIVLSALDFKSLTTKKLLGTTIKFSAPDSSDKKTEYELDNNKKLSTKEILSVMVHVSGLWEAGESVAELHNNGVKIAMLRALYYRLPFSVKPLVATPELPELSFERKKSSTLVLKNDDSVTYPLHWTLVIEGFSVTSKSLVQADPNSTSSITIDPNSTSSITIYPPDEWFTSWFSGLFKKDIRSGFLTLSFRPTGDTDSPNWPVKTIPVKAHLSNWPENAPQFYGVIIIIIMLFLGGTCSIIVSHWVPNKRRRLNIKEQLLKLAEKTRYISHQIDSKPRVSVDMERKRISTILDSRWTISPDLATVFTQCSESIEKLDRRINQLNRIDSIYDRLKPFYAGKTPPTLLERVEKKLQGAAELLQRIEPQESDLDKAQVLITEASLQVEKLDQADEEFAKDLLDWAEELLNKLKGVENDADFNENYEYFEKRLPTLFKFVTPQDMDKWKDPKGIKLKDYFWIDTKISKFNIILHYLHYYNNPTDCTVRESEEKRDKLVEHRDKLVNLLKVRDWSSLRSARLLEQQMEQGIYTSDLVDAIKAGEISIVTDPGIVRAGSPVQFTASFKQKDLNLKAACKELTCMWNFGDGLCEEGWKVSHYFLKKDHPYTVKVRFKDDKGQEIESDNKKDAKGQETESGNEKIIKTKKKGIVKSYDRLWLESIRFFIVLAATVVGLLAGAREQILKLDFLPGLIAVFLIGFGADTIKNILTQRQRTDQ